MPRKKEFKAFRKYRDFDMNGWLKTDSVCTPSNPAPAKPPPFENLGSQVSVKAQKNAWQLKNSGGSKFAWPFYDFKES